MRKYLTEYLAQMEALLKSGRITDYDEEIRKHLCKIEFMQHERLIHFLVTMLFTLGLFITLSVYLMTENFMLIPLLALILVLLVPYIMHYYFLENSVQKMYFIYDELTAQREKARCRQPDCESEGTNGALQTGHNE